MFVLAAVFAVGMAHSAVAGPGCSKSKAGGCAKGAAATASAVEVSPLDSAVTEVMSSLPRMTYKVGDVETPCCKTAHEAAAKSEAPIQYVVAGETFASRESAMDRLAEEIQQELPKLARVSHVVDGEAIGCAQSAAKLASDKNTQVKHTLAGVAFDCPQHAQTVADRLATKLEQSNGCAKAFAGDCDKAATASDKSGCCSKSAGTASAKTGGCSKSAEKSAETVSAKSGGCSHGEKSAETASAKTGGCSKSAEKSAETASAKTGGCSHGDKAAETASAKTGDGSNTETAEAQTASATVVKSGCCSKSKAAAQTAAAGQPAGDEKTEVAAADAISEETPQLANAKLLVREIVEFVAAARNS
jgi:hypothetical protein